MILLLLYCTLDDNIFPKQLSPEVLQAMKSVRFIAQHIKDADKDNEVSVVSEGSGEEILCS